MKKFLTLLCMITCVLSLTACGKEATSLEYNKGDLDIVCNNIYGIISMEYDSAQLEQIQKYDDYEWSQIENNWRQVGLKVSGDVVKDGIDTYMKSLENVGTATGIESIEYTADTDSMTAIMRINGSSHDAEIEILFDSNLQVTSISTNVVYSLAEKMEKAALNTLMGMGTVFTVLILIMFIISAFKFIAKAEKSAADKKKKANETATATETAVEHTIAQLIEKEELELSDDLELVAVISAAIAASEGATSTDGFIVRSIRKHNYR